jgi:hypothetical protein
VTDPTRIRTGVVAALVEQIERDCKRVDAGLLQLAGALDAGAGWPFVGELTPDEATDIAASLAAIGVRAGAILVRDVERTKTREARWQSRVQA